MTNLFESRTSRHVGEVNFAKMLEKVLLVALLQLLALLVAPCAGWISGGSIGPLHVALRMPTSIISSSRGGVMSVSMSSTRRQAIAAGLGSALLTLQPSEAAADMTLTSFKRSYFRWVPRIEAGRDFLVLELGTAIEKETWSEVSYVFVSQGIICVFTLARVHTHTHSHSRGTAIEKETWSEVSNVSESQGIICVFILSRTHTHAHSHSRAPYYILCIHVIMSLQYFIV